MTDFELKHCKNCNQMTNHINDECQKCKKETFEEPNIMAEFDTPLLLPQEFSWELAGIHLGIHMHEVTKDTEILGYCDASKIHVRPRNNGYVFMFYNKETDDKFWLHLDSPSYLEPELYTKFKKRTD